ncbi:MAG: hypothetical protein HOC91_07345 [Nitrospinaceae bacterium]|nr:hypothetical protein [Nitrospinaceae bacterium]MBT3433226.1 hypothetical protein [Nitrospinaceae bacterium]MBT3822547.1 hypothetical protein [Nitrospinaceae bacterium]MBT4093757.1 hypothetical protein [Nitrospinaceae bacterium]MBT4430313.1 hypothetical protein [Nitrospinaceae bacterium]
MRYLVRAFVIKGKERALLEAVESGSLGKGSIAYPTYIKCMKSARLLDNGQVRWIEPCYCREAFGPGGELLEELPYWREYFEDFDIRYTTTLEKCEGYPSCGSCECTEKLEGKLEVMDNRFFTALKK